MVTLTSAADTGIRLVDGCRAEWVDGKLRLEIDPDCELFSTLMKLAADVHPLAEFQQLASDSRKIGEFRFDPQHRIAGYQGHEIFLSRTEARVVEILWRADGAVVPYAKLVKNAWGYADDLKGSELVRAHLRNIRRKLAAAGIPKTLVESVRGRGARIFLPEDPA
jgi:DNA-binding response OmpR family regulator